MRKMSRRLAVFILAFVVVLPVQIYADNNNHYVVCAYLAGWGDWQAENIEVKKLSQINYAFAAIKDDKAVLIQPYDQINLGELQKIRGNNPELKINIAVGGWSYSSEFHKLAAQQELRRKFCASLMALLYEYDLDGVDLDWEYPGSAGADSDAYGPEDRVNFTALAADIRQYLNAMGKRTGKKYQLSFAGAAGEWYLDNIDAGALSNYVDQVNIMTYDFHGGWDKETAHHTNLYGEDGTPSGAINVKKTVKEYIAAGFPVDKLVIGAAFYGRGWHKVNPENNGLYQMSAERGGAEYTYDDLKHRFFAKNGFVRFWDDKACAAYLWNGSEFISYDDERSVAEKSVFVKKNGLRGIMFWEYSQNLSGELLGAIDTALKRQFAIDRP